MVKTFDNESSLAVEFHSEHTTPIRMPATLVNKCIVSVQSPGKTKRIKKRNFLYQFLHAFFRFQHNLHIVFWVIYCFLGKRCIVFKALTKCCFIVLFDFALILLDMPAGVVTLTLYENETAVCSTTVKYYTEMEEICTYLEKVTDPMKFMCQVTPK